MSRKQPFIPAWLDDSGLTSAQFRVYCHGYRRSEGLSPTKAENRRQI